jgi:hypothetical protein
MSWSANTVDYYDAGNMESTTPIEIVPPGDADADADADAEPGVPTLSPSLSSDSQSQGERQVSITLEQSQNNKERVTVPSACVQCRSKHLKCDGLNPCTRCSSNSFECVYVRSRRGFKGPRKNAQNKTATSVTNPSALRACPLVHPGAARGPSNVPSGLVTPPENRLQMPHAPLSLPSVVIGQEVAALDGMKSLPSGLDLRERCIEAFYYHFYPAHPFLLPRSKLFALRKEKRLGHLEAAMRYVGSFYVEKANTTALALEAERSIYHADCAKDGFKVQAMLILVIGLDGYTYQEKALQILIDAQDLALELGMNLREFTQLNGEGSDLLEESWRRTWWEVSSISSLALCSSCFSAC